MSGVITFTPKQVSEEVVVTFDFGPKLVPGETIADIISIVAANQGEVVGSSNVTISGEVHDDTTVQAIVAGGTHLERYLITVKVQGTRQPVLELEAYQRVRNKP